jgi:hypothetical protein
MRQFPIGEIACGLGLTSLAVAAVLTAAFKSPDRSRKMHTEMSVHAGTHAAKRRTFGGLRVSF